MERRELDLTPDPNVLIALTHTPLQPLDALCELIDNSIDSFLDAERSGVPVTFPLIAVDLPGPSEVARRAGAVRVRDNGPGMTPDAAEKALSAGYSAKKSLGTLGLFGMGFNIATGKLGQRTLFTTARESQAPNRVEIDLRRMVEDHTFAVPIEPLEAIEELPHGTVIEISEWWPESNPNYSFIKKLAGYSKDTVRAEIGRRYATILRKNRIRITVNGEPCRPFEHCVWGENRFVERQGHGRIHAQHHFDEVLTVSRRCLECQQITRENGSTCPACNSSSFTTLEERIRGWVGIQRFDDQREFGVDLIRYGRAIRIWEQNAFFKFEDEFKKTIVDYPIDSPYGRIVGEVHLDHVPVDFLKQDFQRTSEQWQRAMSFLRGDSSLQPQQPNADKNRSPVFKLYQGYRRVRQPGTRDMYMGTYNDGKPKRISREVERDYYSKFNRSDFAGATSV